MTETEATRPQPTPDDIRSWLVERVAHYIDQPAETIDPQASLAGYGLDSVYAFALCGEIEDVLDVSVEPTLVWDVANLAELTDRVIGLTAERS
ncbi:acyl carrier protein [Frankia sp. Cas3]|uniref:acyl carrier protein n=1 Tax=Frankia sp. Cas3 TaxID=3073926 RepID=UPI002AD513A4|nr:acyl carrier protein [Frankia sp. Cas3]